MHVLEEEKQRWREKFYLSVVNQRQVRQHWQSIIGRETVMVAKPPQDWVTSSLSKYTSRRVNLTENFREEMKKLLGPDVSGTIVSVERVENTQLWARYVQSRETLAKFGNRKPLSVATFATWMQHQLHIADYVNEALLLYPVSGSDELQHLIMQGLPLRLADLRGSYGSGIYLWEEAEPILSDAPPSNENGISYFLVCRVCLGTPFITSKSLNGISSPPFARIIEKKGKERQKDKEKEKEPEKEKEKEKDKEKDKDKDKEKDKEKDKDKEKEKDKDKEKEKDKEQEKKEKEKEKPEDGTENDKPQQQVLVDSVIAIKSHKQFVVYDRAHCYPEFIISIKLTPPTTRPSKKAEKKEKEEKDNSDGDDAGELEEPQERRGQPDQ